jgi:hypothetical protein
VTTVVIRAVGRPAPQGSKTRGSAGQLREASNYFPAWRQAVKRAALRTLVDMGVAPADRPVFPAGTAVHLRGLTFFLAEGQQPAAAPDIEKLVRAVFDPLTMARVWHDDGQVSSMNEVDEIAYDPRTPPGAMIILSDQRHDMNNPHYRESAPMTNPDPQYARYRITVEGIDDDETPPARLLYVEGPAAIVLPVVPAIGQAIGQPLAAASSTVTPVATVGDNSVPTRRPRRTKAEMEAARAGNGAVPTTPEPGMPPAEVAPPSAAAPYDPFRNR